MLRARKDWLILAGVAIIYFAFTSYQLWTLPGEWYNDITTEHQEVTAILAGGWPWRFNLSAGPAYHYIVAGFAYILGPTYATYKIASLVTGLAVIPLLYLLGKELFDRRAGLLAAAVGALSFWLILFARLGSSPQILSPVLSLAAVYFVARFARTCRYRNIVISMVIASLGLFTYPSTFVLPLVVLALIGWQLVFVPERRQTMGGLKTVDDRGQPAHQPGRTRSTERQRSLALERPLEAAGQVRVRWGWALIVAMLVLAPFVFWFVTVISRSAVFSQSGYVGSKVAGQNSSLAGLGLTFGKNMLSALGMFQFIGDNAFRTNVSGKPVLDLLSGILMDLGLVWLLLNPRLRRRWGYLLIPIVMLVAPSAGPGIPPAEIPSASRALGAAPFVFLLAGLGLEAIWNLAARWISERTPATTAAPSAQPSRPQAGSPLLQPMPVTGGRSGWARWFTPIAQPSRLARILSSLLAALLLAGVAYLNASHYFVAYAVNLPEQNQPWGTEIAKYVDTLPTSIEVRMTSCCWGQWKQPTPQDIYYMLKNKQGRATILAQNYTRTCADLKPGKPYALIFSPWDEDELAATFRGCFPNSTGEVHYDARGHPAFYVLLIR